jgi:hypothetical protein
LVENSKLAHFRNGGNAWESNPAMQINYIQRL